jgi:hypothetical protein
VMARSEGELGPEVSAAGLQPTHAAVAPARSDA